MTPVTTAISIGCLVLMSLPGHAQSDPDLPQPFNTSVMQQLVDNPPFTRVLNLSESLQLTGLAFIDGKPVATVKDSASNKTHVISEVPTADGWKLVSASNVSQIQNTGVQIMVGGVIVDLRYSATQTTPTKKGGSTPSRIPTKEEFTGRDEKGEYVRATPYLSDSDRSKMREIPRDVREKFLNVVHDHRDTLFKASHEDRAKFVKKVFDAVVKK